MLPAASHMLVGMVARTLPYAPLAVAALPWFYYYLAPFKEKLLP
jgi:hypothetical protein